MLKSSCVLFFFITVICYVIVIIGIVIEYKQKLIKKEMEINSLTKSVGEQVEIIKRKNNCIKKLREVIENLEENLYTDSRRNKNGNKRTY